jgi:hypothetical protein
MASTALVWFRRGLRVHDHPPTPTTRSSATSTGRLPPTTPPAARKLPAHMGSFTLEPRGPFTLAYAARFIAGWPPGQRQVDRSGPGSPS